MPESVPKPRGEGAITRVGSDKTRPSDIYEISGDEKVENHFHSHRIENTCDLVNEI